MGTFSPNPVIRKWEASLSNGDLAKLFEEFCNDSHKIQLKIPKGLLFTLKGDVSRPGRVRGPQAGKCTVSEIVRIDRLRIGNDGHDLLVATTKSGCLYDFYTADVAKK